MGKLDGKVAIVLGAAGRDNMGQVIARRFTDEGARVVVAGRRMDELERFAKEIGGLAAQCDITKHDEVFALTKLAKDQLGRVDIGLNCTGWGLLKPFLETTEEEFDEMSALQFKGPFMFYQACIEQMDKGGSIIQISSATATIMLNDHAAYMGAKAGADHLIRVVGHEFGSRGIRANSISPGLTESPMTSKSLELPGVYEAFLAEYPMGRIGTSDDIAAAAVFLSSDECFMTGQNLQVNGGLTLRRNPTGAEIKASVERHAK